MYEYYRLTGATGLEAPLGTGVRSGSLSTNHMLYLSTPLWSKLELPNSKADKYIELEINRFTVDNLRDLAIK